MRVLLTKPATESSSPWYFPSGLGYIARSLLDAGHEVSVLDPEVEGWELQGHSKAIASARYDVLGISALINKYEYVNRLAEASKKAHPDAKVVLGGNITGPVWDLILSKGKVDVCVIGEGEGTVKELLYALEYGADLGDIQGIAFRRNGKPHRTPLRPPVADLDDIPFPAYEVFPMEAYISTPGKLARRGVCTRDLSMITSRGCPYSCTFCYRPPWEKVRSRSPENVRAELRLLMDSYGVDGITFNDELTMRSSQYVFRLCEVMEELGIKWGCSGRVNVATLELLERMHEAGCRWMTYGIESGSQTILDEMNKRVKVEQAKNVVKWTKKVGIATNPTFMLGLPSESRATAMETVNFMKETGLHPDSLFFATPYPGTVLFDQAVKLGRITGVEEYLEYIEGRDAHTLIVNLTKMSDQELIDLRDEVLGLVKPGVWDSTWGLLKKAVNIIRTDGWRNFYRKVRMRIRGF